MRGKEVKGYFRFPNIGITPAYAGKRPDAVSNTDDYGDHPRICGEKPLCSFFKVNSMGSPPHMRGKVP